MIFELHKKDPLNIGDYYCNPSRYFKFENLQSGNLLKNKFNLESSHLIVGGGGLIHRTFDEQIINALNQRPLTATLWSAGHNYGPAAYRKNKNILFPDYIKQFNLVGIRDWLPNYKQYYLPCVTCMHPTFDQTRDIKHDYVFYFHETKTSNFSIAQKYPCMTNNSQQFEEVIDFLGSGDTVITNSYHGAYWALLLGRKVITVAWSIKFHFFKYLPTIIDTLDNWPKHAGKTADKNYLSESRHLNRQFYQQFLNLL